MMTERVLPSTSTLAFGLRLKPCTRTRDAARITPSANVVVSATSLSAAAKAVVQQLQTAALRVTSPWLIRTGLQPRGCLLERSWGFAATSRARRLRRKAVAVPAASEASGSRRPERIFLVPFPRIGPDPLPALDPSNLSVWERFDTLCRCIVSALMTSRSVRSDVRFVALFTKPPEADAPVKQAFWASLQGERLPGAPPHTRLEVHGAGVRTLYAEERWVAATIRKAVERFHHPKLGQLRANSARTAGWHVTSFDTVAELLRELTVGFEKNLERNPRTWGRCPY